MLVRILSGNSVHMVKIIEMLKYFLICFYTLKLVTNHRVLNVLLEASLRHIRSYMNV